MTLYMLTGEEAIKKRQDAIQLPKEAQSLFTLIKELKS